jgi:threonine synthase
MNCVNGLACIGCGKEYSVDQLYNCPDCGEILNFTYDMEKVRQRLTKVTLKKRSQSLWRYEELLPVAAARISLNEGSTSLHKCERFGKLIGLKSFYVKDESRNPTGSFKDRQISVSMSLAVERGARAVATISSGNAGAASAAYSARAGLPCIVLVSSEASASKLSQIIAYGAKIVLVHDLFKGSVWDSLRLFKELCQSFQMYPLNWSIVNPSQLEGNKTIAYEVCEQLQWNVPDWVITPVGTGDNLAGEWKGFSEFRELGFVKSVPKMAGIQAVGAAPLVNSLRQGATKVQPMTNPQTIALGIMTRISGTHALRAVEESHGAVETVTEAEIVEAERLLARTEGIFAEPSSAAAVAGVKKLGETGSIDADEKVVCVVTGFGLKDPGIIIQDWNALPKVSNNLTELDHVVRMLLSGVSDPRVA